MLRIQIDDRDLPANDPMRDLITLAHDIRLKARYVTLEAIFEAGELVRLRKTESLKISRPG